MKRYFLLFTVFAVTLLVCSLSFQTLHSNIAAPVAGKDGNPTEIPPGQTCNYCHGGSYEHDATANSLLKIGESSADTLMADFHYAPNKTYTISFTPMVTSRRYGFQMSALDPNNNNGGSFIVTDPTHTQLISIPINYISHHNAAGFKNWTFQWTSPASDIGDITFYYAFVQADSNDQNTNDTVYKGTTVLHGLNTAISEANSFRNLIIGPNPAHGRIRMSFENVGSKPVIVDLFSVDGKLVRNLFNENNSQPTFNQEFDIRDVNAGIYMLKITSGTNAICRKVVVN